MASIERYPERDSVTQDNQLIEASYTLTLNEKRLLLLGASKINPLNMPKKNEPLSFEVTADEWIQRFPEENPYTTMKRAADSMLTRYVTLHPKTGNTKKMAWFDSVEYIDGEAKVKIQFGWSVSLRLAGMISEFTKINLLSVQQLNSFHSVRLYELLSQFRGTGYRRITLEDFRIAMDCVNSYSQMRDLKKRVLTPALKELSAKTDIEVICTDVKKGRRIVGFEFLIKTNSQQDMFR